MLNMDKLDELQAAADYQVLEKRLQSAAVGGLIFGTLSIILGAAFLGDSQLNWIPIGLGSAIVLAGLWGVGAPGLLPLAVDGLMLLAVGCWNIWVSFHNAPYTPAIAGGPLLAPALGVLQIAWGLQDLARVFKRWGRPLHSPTDEIQEEYEEMLGQLEQSERTVAFSIRTFVKQQFWRGFLLDGAAVFFEGKHGDIVLAAKDDVTLNKLGDAKEGRLVRAAARIGNHREPAVELSQEDYERYREWKNEAACGRS